MTSHRIAKSFGTHDGSFHGDEVTACALLLLFGLIDRNHIYRSRDPGTLERCEFVCDVGGLYSPGKKRFDHHQPEYKGLLSSAGMILLYLKEIQKIDQALYDHFNHSLIIGVDAHDNGIVKQEEGVSSFSHIISNFMPIAYDATAKERENCFFQAVDFALGHLSRLKERFFYNRSCLSKVEEVMSGDKQVLVFEEPIPWMDSFFALGGENHPALFVIMPTGVHWKLRGIPLCSKEPMSLRYPLPAAWAGLHKQELVLASKIEGAIFCHKGRFISIWETKQDALQAVHKVLENKGV